MGRSKRPDAIPEPQKEKRGRGRPRKANAMSGAQRQASYRARQAANGISVTVTKKDVIDAASHAAVLHERDRLLQEVAQLRGATSMRTTRASKTGSEIIDQALGSAVPENDLGLDEKRLSVTLNGAQGFALTRLTAHYRLTQRIVLERLLNWADEAIIASLAEDDTLFNRYLKRSNGK